MTIREKLLEEKIITLEQRLLLVERFVELRYCETFRDFTIRNSGSGNKKFGDGGSSTGAGHGPPTSDNDNEEEEDDPNPSNARSTRSRITKQATKKNQPGPASSKGHSSSGNKEVLKDCVVRIVKTTGAGEQNASTDETVKGTSPGSSNIRYGTRRQTRMSQQQQQQQNATVKYEIINEVADDDNDFTTPFLEMETGEDDGGDYFTFPGDQNDQSAVDNANNEVVNNGDNSMEGEGRDHHDHVADWSSNDDCDNSEHDDEDADSDDIESTGNKRKQTKRKYKPTGKPRGRKKKKVIGPKKPNHVYYLSSISDLSHDTKIVSTDPTRAECPICRQYWKVERIEEHIASHTKERHLKCPHCDKSYCKIDDLRNHLKTKHNRDKHYPKCRICREPIVRKMILHEKFCVKRALQRGDDVEETLVEDIRQQCAKEGLEFVLPNETVPPGLDPTERIKCDQCNRYFQRRIYDRHVKSHSLARNWKCSKCPKAYIHKHDLIRHMCITHESNLKCELCEEKFETRGQLHSHKLKCRKSKGLPSLRTSEATGRAMKLAASGEMMPVSAEQSLDGEEGEEIIEDPSVVVETEHFDGDAEESVTTRDEDTERAEEEGEELENKQTQEA